MPPVTGTQPHLAEQTTTFHDIFEEKTDTLTTYWAYTVAEGTTEIQGDFPVNMPTDESNVDSLVSYTKILLASVSLVVGCFALTALILRIGSRLKKSKMQALEKKRHQQRMSINNSKKSEEPKQQTHKRLTIRMHPTQDSKNRKPSSKSRKTTTFALNGSACKDSPGQSSDGGNRPLRRNRTVEALIEIGAFPKDFVLPERREDESVTTAGETATNSIKTETVIDMDSILASPSDKIRSSQLYDNGTTYTNEAFDQENPDKINSVYIRRMSDNRKEDFTSRNTNTVLNKAGRMSPPQYLEGDDVLTMKELCKFGGDLSDGSINGKEDDSMLEYRRYSSASSLDSDGSPIATRRPIRAQILKAADKNRNNSRDSGYVESVASQESIKKRKLGIMEPFHNHTYLENTPSGFSPLRTLESSHVHFCPTCQTPTAQRPYYHRHVSSTAVYHKVQRRVEPFRKCVSVPFRSPDDGSHLPVNRNFSYDSSLLPIGGRGWSSSRSHIVVAANTDYSMEDSRFAPTHRFFRKRNSETQTDGAPLHRKSTVRWNKEGANYILTPVNNNEIDHLGPIYLTPET